MKMFAASHFQRVLLAGNTSTVWKRKLATFTLLNARYASTDGSDCGKKHLFKIARASKRIRTYDNDKIDKPRAMAEFGLKETDLADLKIHLAPTMGRSSAEKGLYALNDVRHRAVKVHGSSEAVDAYRRPLITMGNELTDAEQMRMRMRVETTASESKGSDWVVKRAFLLNVCDASFKFCAAYLTGSKSLFAEAIHSLMDSCNQLILMVGLHVSSKNPDTLFPYGYGNMRYVTSLISGCGIMAFGCGLSIYHGVSGLLNPAELEPLTYAYMALTASLCFQGSSAFFAWREARQKAAEARVALMDYVKTAADPSLNVVLLEDTAAVVGVGIALTCVGASSILESPYPDAVGSILIGTLLGVVAGFIIRTNAAHLVGRSLPPRVTDDIVSRLKKDPVILSIHDVKTTSLGVEQSRFKAEIDFNGREITHSYLKRSVSLTAMLEEVKQIETEEQLKNFMEGQGEKIIDRLGNEIDRIEGDIMRRHPDIRHIDIEAL